VLAVLPGKPRHGGTGYRQAGLDVQQLYRHRSVFARLATASVVISPCSIARSDYNLAHLGPAQLAPYKGLPQLFRQIAKTIKRAREPTTVYAYWPDLDSLGHAQGIESDQARAHLGAIEQQLSQLLDRLKGSDTQLLICADHGQLDADPARSHEVSSDPELLDCLRMPLCGEPRAAYCYLRPGQAQRFERLYGERLQQDFQLWRSSELIEQGLFGLGPAHPCLAERVGDYCLIARDRALIHHRLIGDKPFQQVGVHGGLSLDELMVPLCRFDL
jgi:hypothetical protein